MQILKIKISRDPNKVFLSVSNGLFIPLFIDDLVTLKIKPNQEITSEDLDKILQTSLVFLLKEYALKQVSLSPKTAFILSLKLKKHFKKICFKYKFPAIPNAGELIQNCISSLDRQNFLKEIDFIESFINKNKYKSKMEIEYLLSRQGINNHDLIKMAVSKINEKERIKNLIDKKNNKNKIKLMGYLARKGFSLNDIKSVIDGSLNSR